MKRIIYALISCCAICTGLFMIIHRNVIAAYLTGKPIPEAPEWHQKFIHKKEEE